MGRGRSWEVFWINQVSFKTGIYHMEYGSWWSIIWQFPLTRNATALDPAPPPSIQIAFDLRASKGHSFTTPPAPSITTCTSARVYAAGSTLVCLRRGGSTRSKLEGANLLQGHFWTGQEGIRRGVEGWRGCDLWIPWMGLWAWRTRHVEGWKQRHSVLSLW
ncbi:hypothetical protein BDZ91DRAFT_516836 [Kalaharituber pfeilii]|nr:hypothetical protein BDZ91DRAFT_516836 [Kalaharituber pfeilii]